MNDINERYICDFATYEDYLNTQISPIDLFYLENEEVARNLVELGYRGGNEVIKKEDFDRIREDVKNNRLTSKSRRKPLANIGKDFDDPFLIALAEREESNRYKKLQTIVFIRDYNAQNQEISGYIDLAHRFRSEDFEEIFSGARRFLPKPTDLSFCNWDTHSVSSNNSPNFELVAESAHTGMKFRNRFDRQTIHVGPESKDDKSKQTTRSRICTDKYLQVIFYDHKVRAKGDSRA